MATGLENLNIYNMAKNLELEVHKIIGKFPYEEKLRSTGQLARSSASVSNNIAESYYKRSLKDKIRILRDIVIGEIEETRTNLLRCSQKGFLTENMATETNERYIELRMAIFGYIRFLHNGSNISTSKLSNSQTDKLIN